MLGLFACSEGHDQFLHAPDLGPSTDAAEAQLDLTPVDLMGPDCGQIMICVLQQCALTNLTCDQACVAGAQPAALQQSGALILCAATNCLAGLAGGDGGAGIGGMLAIISCIETKCPMQTNACEGLPFAAPL